MKANIDVNERKSSEKPFVLFNKGEFVAILANQDGPTRIGIKVNETSVFWLRTTAGTAGLADHVPADKLYVDPRGVRVVVDL